MSIEKICFPVHRGLGLMIAGIGKHLFEPYPATLSGTHIPKSIATSFSTKVSL